MKGIGVMEFEGGKKLFSFDPFQIGAAGKKQLYCGRVRRVERSDDLYSLEVVGQLERGEA